jgi:restriction system protein
MPLENQFPSGANLRNAILEVLSENKGGLNNKFLEDKVAQLVGLSQLQLSEKMADGKRYKFSYRLAWAKSELKISGAIQKNSKGLWVKL